MLDQSSEGNNKYQKSTKTFGAGKTTALPFVSKSDHFISLNFAPETILESLFPDSN